MSHPAFELIRREHVASLDVTLEQYRHSATAASHIHLASDNSNNACDSGTDAGLACSQSSLTACTFGVPATIGCVNADCGSAGGIAHQCGPADLAANTPDSALMPFGPLP